MGIGSFLFGSPGGLDKNQKRRLEAELAANAGNTVGPDFLDFIRRTLEPGFARQRRRIGQRYASADAPIVSGGRTLEEIDLAGEEAGAIGQMTQEELQRRRQRYMQILGLLSQPKPASGGLLGAAASGVGAYLGAGGRRK